MCKFNAVVATNGPQTGSKPASAVPAGLPAGPSISRTRSEGMFRRLGRTDSANHQHEMEALQQVHFIINPPLTHSTYFCSRKQSRKASWACLPSDSLSTLLSYLTLMTHCLSLGQLNFIQNIESNV